jgi:hypothetical protein
MEVATMTPGSLSVSAMLTRLAVMAAWLTIGTRAGAQVTQRDLDGARALHEQGKHAEAASAYADLRSRLTPEQAALAPALDLNRACALLAAKQPDEAEKAFLEADARATDAIVRSAARSNLGAIASARGDGLAGQKEGAEPDIPGALEAYRRAERHFRNALGDRPDDAGARRNIEIIQRKIARLLEQQKKKEEQQQQQDSEKRDQQNQGEQKKDQQDQKQQNKTENKDEQKPESQQQGKDGQPQDQKQGQPEPEQDPKQQDDAKKPEDPKEQGDPKDQKASDGSQQQQRPTPPTPTAQQKREFDRLAAEILDKEKKQRERFKQMMQLMRSRAAPVEKDW